MAKAKTVRFQATEPITVTRTWSDQKTISLGVGDTFDVPNKPDLIAYLSSLTCFKQVRKNRNKNAPKKEHSE